MRVAFDGSGLRPNLPNQSDAPRRPLRVSGPGVSCVTPGFSRFAVNATGIRRPTTPGARSIMKYICLAGVIATLACANQAIPAATAPTARPLVEICFPRGTLQRPGPPGYDALTTGHLTVRLTTESAYGIPAAQPSATVVPGAIDLATRIHTFDTRPLIGYRQNSIAWTWSSTDSILVEIGPAGSHTSMWLVGKRISADSATGQWYGPGYGLDRGSFVLSGLSSAAPGRLIPVCGAGSAALPLKRQHQTVTSEGT